MFATKMVPSRMDRWESKSEAPEAAKFLQKRLISEFFGFQWQNLAEILSLFLGGHFGSFLAHFRSFGAI